jgi:hypothetical protein
MAILPFSLNKDSIKSGWDDPPMRVLLFRVGINCINYFQIATVRVCESEFDIVVGIDSVKWKEGIGGQPMQCISARARIVELRDEVGQCILKYMGPILTRNVTKGDHID